MFTNLELFTQDKSVYKQSLVELESQPLNDLEKNNRKVELEENFKAKVRKYLPSALDVLKNTFQVQYSIYKVGKDFDANFHVVETNVRKTKQEVIADMEQFKSMAASMTLTNDQIMKINLAMDVLLTYSEDAAETTDVTKDSALEHSKVMASSIVAAPTRENNAFTPAPSETPVNFNPYANQPIVVDNGFKNPESYTESIVDPFKSLYGDSSTGGMTPVEQPMEEHKSFITEPIEEHKAFFSDPVPNDSTPVPNNNPSSDLSIFGVSSPMRENTVPSMMNNNSMNMAEQSSPMGVVMMPSMNVGTSLSNNGMGMPISSPAPIEMNNNSNFSMNYNSNMMDNGNGMASNPYPNSGMNFSNHEMNNMGMVNDMNMPNGNMMGSNMGMPNTMNMSNMGMTNNMNMPNGNMMGNNMNMENNQMGNNMGMNNRNMPNPGMNPQNNGYPNGNNNFQNGVSLPEEYNSQGTALLGDTERARIDNRYIISKLITGALTIPLAVILTTVISIAVVYGLDKTGLSVKLAENFGDYVTWIAVAMIVVMSFIASSSVLDPVAKKTRYVGKYMSAALCVYSGVLFLLIRYLPEILSHFVKDSLSGLFTLTIYVGLFTIYGFLIGTFLILGAFLRTESDGRVKKNIFEILGTLWSLYTLFIPTVLIALTMFKVEDIVSKVAVIYDYSNAFWIIVIVSFLLPVPICLMNFMEERKARRGL